MNTTEIHLSDEKQRALHSLAQQAGKSEEEIIQTAIESFIAQKYEERLRCFRQARGMWKDRTDIEFEEIRKSWDRDFSC